MHINVFEDSVISDAKEKVQVNVSQGKLRAKKPFYKDQLASITHHTYNTPAPKADYFGKAGGLKFGSKQQQTISRDKGIIREILKQASIDKDQSSDNIVVKLIEGVKLEGGPKKNGGSIVGENSLLVKVKPIDTSSNKFINLQAKVNALPNGRPMAADPYKKKP